jgi:O-methyltransferase involved in polyketide biosynthesis
MILMPGSSSLPDRVKIFEVDHPATQSDKLAKLQVIFGKIPEHIIYVSIDFLATGQFGVIGRNKAE